MLLGPGPVPLALSYKLPEGWRLYCKRPVKVLVHGSELPSVPLSLDGPSMTPPSFPSQGQLTEQCWLQAWGEDCLAGRHLCGYGWCPGSEGQGQPALAAFKRAKRGWECENGVTGSEQELAWQISG